MKRHDVMQLFTAGLNPVEEKMTRRLRSQLADEFIQWIAQRDKAEKAQLRNARRRFGVRADRKDVGQGDDRRDPDRNRLRDVYDFLIISVGKQWDAFQELQRQHAAFRRYLATTNTVQERRRMILQSARQLGASPRALRDDERAFDRWFGEDALGDRFIRRRGETEQRIAFLLQQVGHLASATIQSVSTPDNRIRVWQRMDVERTLLRVLSESLDGRVLKSAIRCLNTIIDSFDKIPPSTLLSDRLMTVIHRLSMDKSENVWVQCEAFDCLERLDVPRFHEIVASRLEATAMDDDIFVRRHVVRTLGRRRSRDRHFPEHLARVARDPSPFVRQQLTAEIYRTEPAAAIYWMTHLIREDTEARVRAAAIIAGIEHANGARVMARFVELLKQVIEHESDPFVVRCALHAAGEMAETCQHEVAGRTVESIRELEIGLRTEVVPAAERLIIGAPQISVRRWASRAVQRITLSLDRRLHGLQMELRKQIDGLPLGHRRKLSGELLRGFTPDEIGQVLAVLAQDDFGYDLERTWTGRYVTRGPLFRFRWWRFLHELRTPAPDKRQAHRHTIGRMSPASVRAPSAILAELSETKVPGEPLYMSDEDGWRPYLPLVDDFLSALQVSEPVRFFTSSGVTQVTPPRTVWQRYRTAMILTVHFAHYAKLRNWTDAEQTPASSYVRAMETLGFQVEFLSSRQYERTDKSNRTYRAATDEKDQSVHRFFGVLLPFAVAGPLESVERVVVDFVDYFNSIYQNSLVQLFLFMFGAAGAFMATHLVANYRFRYARTSVPICIGGWGTRGKSGTERLKAALINALGYSLISKSSGCEAMFIMGETYGEAREIIIYRPYDKATIWEQHNLMLIAAKSQRDVFLWECMGLTPAYVDVLQRQWTRDDLSTITNAYPDHEDVQGPSGWDVARTISGFVPRHSTLVTSEQQMLPLLREECVKMKTRLHTVNWIQSGLLTDDVLARFPYLEHPDNIALVTSLAELLGCHADFALKEMADRLIPDLGVLKTYPPAPVRTRRLEFINGMSANERYGCINNWKRMGFDRQDPYQEPGTWITTVVNNRADRVPRSRVFARILVFDISADRHYLIGNNLKGLQGFIWEAWEEYIANVSLWSGQNSQRSESPQEVLQRLAIRFRQPFRPEHVQARFAAMLPAILHASGRTDAQGKQLKEIEGLWNQPDRAIQRLTQLRVTDDLCRSVLEHLTEWNESLLAFQSLSEQISATSSAEQSSLDRQLHALLRRWFARKLVVVEDYHATGDEVISAICAETPAGFLNRIMGVQNIKGTGLDFVYRWLAWEKCFQACQLLSDGKPNGTQQGLQMLAEFQEFGVLTNELARDTLQRVKRSPTAQREQFQADIELISNRLNQAARAAEASASHDEGEVHWMNRWLVSALEDFLDVGDAVYRRKQADQIYRDLIHQRISWSRAVLELRALSKRQKGGWLADRLRSLQVWLSGRTGMLAHLPTVEAVPEKKPATATTVPHGAAASDSEAPLPRGSARGFPPIDSSLPLPPYQPDFFEETY